MRLTILKYGLLILLMSICSFGWGREAPIEGIDTCILAPGDSLVVTCRYDNEGLFRGTLVVQSEDQCMMSVDVSMNCFRNSGSVSMYDGINRNAHAIGRYQGMSEHKNQKCYSGVLCICFSLHLGGPIEEITFKIKSYPKSSDVFNIDSYKCGDVNTMVTWEDVSGTTEWRVMYGSLNSSHPYYEQKVSHPMILLPSEDCRSLYFCRIFDANDSNDGGSDVYSFVGYQGISVCDDFADLLSCNVQGSYGIYTDPYQDKGIVDYGYGSINSRHTVHSDTSEYDPQTENQLRTVPPGELMSVRLGNSENHAQAESLTYSYKVDTAINDLLIMKYAVVMQEPNHDFNYQPKFEFEILDDYGNAYDSICYSRLYTANSNLGWHSALTDVLWKDWTTVGIPLDGLHGQTIRLRFTTYDCFHGGHFGYAYFNLKCSNKIIKSESCGDLIANTFTAPEGFKYKWYAAGNMDSVLSTDRSLNVTDSGEYKCILTMEDVPEGACEVELSATATHRYPCARFESEMVGHECDRIISFHERSSIAMNEDHTVLLNEPCEDILWDFGDGEISSDRNPIHKYDEPGIYEVTMVASLAGNVCTDTIKKMIVVGVGCTNVFVEDTICIDENYVFFDTIVNTPGQYIHLTDTGTTILFLSVVDYSYATRYDTVVENQLPYRYNGFLFDTIVEDSIIAFPKLGGCDSVVHYNLMVHYNTSAEVEESVCKNEFPYVREGVVYDSAGVYNCVYTMANGADSVVELTLKELPIYSVMVNDSMCEGDKYRFIQHEYDSAGIYVDSLTSVLGCDSVVTLNLSVIDNIHTTDHITICRGSNLVWQDGNIYDEPTTDPLVVYEALNGCDSIVHLSLDTSILDARCIVSPLHVTEENSDVALVDISKGGNGRKWYLPNIVSEEDRWTYHYPLMEDSVKVLFVATDEFGCVDSIERWIYNVSPEIWIPNAFTPGEETNNIFRPMHKDLLDIKVLIYTRRGQRVYSYDTLDGYWDGTFKGKNCPQGAYVYKIIYHTKIQPEEKKTAVGTVVLIR